MQQKKLNHLPNEQAHSNRSITKAAPFAVSLGILTETGNRTMGPKSHTPARVATYERLHPLAVRRSTAAARCGTRVSSPPRFPRKVNPPGVVPGIFAQGVPLREHMQHFLPSTDDIVQANENAILVIPRRPVHSVFDGIGGYLTCLCKIDPRDTDLTRGVNQQQKTGPDELMLRSKR